MIQRFLLIVAGIFFLLSDQANAFPYFAALHAGRAMERAFSEPGQHQASAKPAALSEEDALRLYPESLRRSGFGACKDLFPGGKPFGLDVVSPDMRPLALCSNSFAVLYSQTSKTPLVAVERLTAEQLRDARGEERSNQFYPDPRIPKSGRAELSDYHGTGLDRGHQAPAADSPNQNAMAQSFALSNMVPQSPESNRNAWADVEKATRKFASRASGNVFVFTGPIFEAGHDAIGANKVWVPTKLFKLVFDEATGRTWAFILPNDASAIQRPVDYVSFVRETGLRLLPM